MYKQYKFAWKFFMNHGISPSASKNVTCFYLDLFSNGTKFPIWGNFVEEDQCLVYFRLRIGKKHLKSSKMRRVRGVNDSINTFFIRYGYRLMEKNWYYRYTIYRYASLLELELLLCCLQRKLTCFGVKIFLMPPIMFRGNRTVRLLCPLSCRKESHRFFVDTSSGLPR